MAETIDFNGNPLGPLRASVGFPISFSPGPDGGLLVASQSGEIHQFAADLSFVRKRRVADFPVYYGGIDLAIDRCTVYWAARHSIIRWDACLDTAPLTLTPVLPFDLGAIRVLPDLTILVSNLEGSSPPAVLRLASDGHVIREYAMVGDVLALDIDATSFWTIRDDQLVRVDIATGAVLASSVQSPRFAGVTYEVQRGQSIHGPFVTVACGASGCTDAGLASDTTYVYRVRAMSAGGASEWAVDPARTTVFTDPSLTAGMTMIKTAHVLELRQAVAGLRAAGGLNAFAWSDHPLLAGMVVKSVHVTELRTALVEARAVFGLTTAAYTDGMLTSQVAVKAIHVEELRQGVR